MPDEQDPFGVCLGRADRPPAAGLDCNDQQAKFAFVMGTDPEVVVLLVAVERDDKLVWQYAFARATAYAVEASLGDELVWSASAATGPTPTASLMQIFRPIPPSP